jgi:ribosomal protein S18 acetylase RimI-like enzyme
VARLANLGRRLFEVARVDVLEWRSDKPIPDPTEADGVAIRRLSLEEPRAREVLPKSPSKVVDSYLARGDLGYVATVGDRFAGWVWLSRTSHRDPFSGLHIRIAPDEAYAYALRAEKADRQLGIAPILMSRLLSDVRGDDAISRVYGWVDHRNRESQTLLRMMFGFTQVQRVRRLHALRIGWQVPWSDDPKFGPVSRVGRHSTVA